MSGLLLATQRPLAKMVSALLVPTSRDGLVMLDFAEYPAIRTESGHATSHLLARFKFVGSLGSNRQMSWPISLSAGRQLPGDPSKLIGQRNRRKFWRLALKKALQPRPMLTAASSDVPDNSRCTDYEKTPQDLVTSLCNRSKSSFARSRMISRRKADPCGEMPRQPRS